MFVLFVFEFVGAQRQIFCCFWDGRAALQSFTKPWSPSIIVNSVSLFSISRPHVQVEVVRDGIDCELSGIGDVIAPNPIRNVYIRDICIYIPWMTLREPKSQLLWAQVCFCRIPKVLGLHQASPSTLARDQGSFERSSPWRCASKSMLLQNQPCCLDHRS